MSQIKIDSEDIAEIKNALQIILLNATLITPQAMRTETILEQTRRIDNLLPVVNFEGGK